MSYMTFDSLVDALNETGIPFAEGAWQDAHKMRDHYGVYALDGVHDLLSDDQHSDRLVEGTVDLFVLHSRGSDQAGWVENALETSGVIWRLNYGPSYESNTGYTHWEWVFDCLPERGVK